MHRDLQEFVERLNAAGADYLIGGGYAVALHARPRFTKDVDIYIRKSPGNVAKVHKAIRGFFGGTPPRAASKKNLADPEVGVQIGEPPVAVDLMLAPATGSFNAFWKRRVESRFGKVRAHYISVEDLIAEKKHYDSDQDRADVAALQRTLGKQRHRRHKSRG